MKEVLTKNFWRDVKKTFEDARDGVPDEKTKPATEIEAEKNEPKEQE